MNLRLIRLSLYGLSMAFGLVGLLAFYFSTTPVTYTQDTQRNLPDLGGPFTLIDQFGKMRTDQDFRGKFRLIYFGYTFCPDVCPLGLQNMSEALKILGTDLQRLVPLFITIDPERDTPDNLLGYSSSVHPSFVLLTGSQKQLDPVLKSFKVYAVKAKPDGTVADYLMDHSSLIYLMDPEGKLIDFFPHTLSPQDMADKIYKHLIKDFQEKS